MVGRPKQFVREEALESAMGIFWDKGFEAASVQDLLDEMGINRGSMYDTFGDKRALFLDAIQHYAQHVETMLINPLQGSGKPSQRIKKFLKTVIELNASGERRGCFFTNTIVEEAPHDREVAGILRGVLDRLENAVRICLDEAVKAGELNPQTNTTATARQMITIVQGLAVMSRLKMSKTWMRTVICNTYHTFFPEK